MAKKKVGHYRSRQRKRAGALALPPPAPPEPSQMETAKAILTGEAKAPVALLGSPDTTTPDWIYTPTLPLIPHVAYHDPVDLMGMAHEANEKHFRDWLPVDPVFHGGGKVGGSIPWDQIGSIADATFSAAGGFAIATGAAMTPIAPEFGLPLAAGRWHRRGGRGRRPSDCKGC